MRDRPASRAPVHVPARSEGFPIRPGTCERLPERGLTTEFGCGMLHQTSERIGLQTAMRQGLRPDPPLFLRPHCGRLAFGGKAVMVASTLEKRALGGICPAGCWVVASLDDEGRLKKVRADQSASFGALCRLGELSSEIVYSENRLLYPMRRRGPKGTHDFERISWDQAYDLIAKKPLDIKKSAVLRRLPSIPGGEASRNSSSAWPERPPSSLLTRR